jgi:hypothetical protein
VDDRDAIQAVLASNVKRRPANVLGCFASNNPLGNRRLAVGFFAADIQTLGVFPNDHESNIRSGVVRPSAVNRANVGPQAQLLANRQNRASITVDFFRGRRDGAKESRP